MIFSKMKVFVVGVWLTYIYSLKLKYTKGLQNKQKKRLEYSKRILKNFNFDVKIANEEKLPKEGQYLFFMNHRGIIDIPVLDVLFKNTSLFGSWIVKRELYSSLFFSMAVKHGGCIPLDREKVSKKFFTDVQSAVKQGSSIFLFPEGTRNKTEYTLLPFMKGLGLIASKNKLDLLPIYIKTNSAKALQDSLNTGNPQQEITVVIGDIIKYDSRVNLEETYRKNFHLEN